MKSSVRAALLAAALGIAAQAIALGARLVGGCCGTTPEHIRQMKLAVAGAGRASAHVRTAGDGTIAISSIALAESGAPDVAIAAPAAPVPRPEKSRLAGNFGGLFVGERGWAVLLVGSGADRPVCGQIASQLARSGSRLNRAVDMSGKTDLPRVGIAYSHAGADGTVIDALAVPRLNSATARTFVPVRFFDHTSRFVPGVATTRPW